VCGKVPPFLGEGRTDTSIKYLYKDWGWLVIYISNIGCWKTTSRTEMDIFITLELENFSLEQGRGLTIDWNCKVSL
jgi:hypothetical protein